MFKQLLEYFVAHLEYVEGGKHPGTRGYEEYIAPIPTADFCIAGQGYLGHDIQKQIAGYDTFYDRQVCITVVKNYRSYITEASYLHWKDAWTKIVAVPNEDRTRVTALRIRSPTGFLIDPPKPDDWDIAEEMSLTALGLFDHSDTENETLRHFLEVFHERLLVEPRSSI